MNRGLICLSSQLTVFLCQVHCSLFSEIQTLNVKTETMADIFQAHHSSFWIKNCCPTAFISISVCVHALKDQDFYFFLY